MTSSQRNAVICPHCRKLISTSETKCPYCGLKRPSALVHRAGWAAVLRSPRHLIQTLVVINAAMFLFSLLLFPGDMGLSPSPLSFLTPPDSSLLLVGATGTIPIVKYGRWWTLLTANYLHGSLLHILFNMFALRYIFLLVSREFGTARVIIVYTIGGAVGFWVSYMAGIRLTIGASAAVCSLIGAALYFGKTHGGVYGKAVFQQIGGWAVGLMLFGLMPGINNWGHGGGMAAGFLLGYLLGYQAHRPEKRWHQWLAAACVTATLAALAWAVVTSVLVRIAY